MKQHWQITDKVWWIESVWNEENEALIEDICIFSGNELEKGIKATARDSAREKKALNSRGIIKHQYEDKLENRVKTPDISEAIITVLLGKW